MQEYEVCMPCPVRVGMHWRLPCPQVHLREQLHVCAGAVIKDAFYKEKNIEHKGVGPLVPA